MNTLRVNQAIRRVFRAFCSIKLAVFVLAGLAAALASATILESAYDTATGQYWVYHALWFHVLLGLLGLNIFCVAMSRWPWRKSHFPFLTAHLGILMLLLGAALTESLGIDGTLRVAEGESARRFLLGSWELVVTTSRNQVSIPIAWHPVSNRFHFISLSDFGVPAPFVVDKFLPHADRTVRFVPAPEHIVGHIPEKTGLAVRLKVTGGPMNANQEFWLWAGELSLREVQAGPARLALGSEPSGAGPSLTLRSRANGDLDFVAISSAGERQEGIVSKDDPRSALIAPPWNGGVRIEVLEWVRNAKMLLKYAPALVQFGKDAPPPALHLSSPADSTGEGVWLGAGDHAMVYAGEEKISVAYLPKVAELPFAVRLNQFSIGREAGSADPTSYESRITAIAGEEHVDATISMNQPFKKDGFTLYQSSYEEGDPKPVTSILTVNRDPGRWFKYLGSLLIVIGSIALFGVKYAPILVMRKKPA